MAFSNNMKRMCQPADITIKCSLVVNFNANRVTRPRINRIQSVLWQYAWL